MLRILHLGDLHLCSAFAAFAPSEAAARRARQMAALDDLLKSGVTRGAQLVLFAGDCFDTPVPDPDFVERFFGMLAALPVPVVIAPGNHDYYRPDGLWNLFALPANVRLFRTPSLSYFDFPDLGATVYGYAFTAERAVVPPLSRAAELPPDRTAILLAHADMLSPLSPYAPLTAGALETGGFDYAALGHIHKPVEPRRVGRTTVAYCGFFAGRGFDECKNGGGRYVEIDKGAVRIEFIAAQADVFLTEQLDCTGAMSGEEVRARVAAYLGAAAYPAGTALRLTLTGEVGLACRPDPAALAHCGAALALFEVRDETLPVFDAGYLEKDPSLRGAFYRAMKPRLESADPEIRAVAAAALRDGFAALAGKEVSV